MNNHNEAIFQMEGIFVYNNTALVVGGDRSNLTISTHIVDLPYAIYSQTLKRPPVEKLLFNDSW